VSPHLVLDGVLLATALNEANVSALKEGFLRSGVLILIGLVPDCPGGVDVETVLGDKPRDKSLKVPLVPGSLKQAKERVCEQNEIGGRIPHLLGLGVPTDDGIVLKGSRGGDDPIDI